MNKNMTTTNDKNIWKALPAHEDGFVPHVKRVWQYVARGCNFPVELVKAHPSIEGMYSCNAVFAMNCLYTPDWVLVGRDVVATA